MWVSSTWPGCAIASNSRKYSSLAEVAKRPAIAYQDSFHDASHTDYLLGFARLQK
jgi:hypothetical protein